MTMAEETASPRRRKGIAGGREKELSHLMGEIARVLDECQLSNAVHNRKLKELSTILRSSSSLANSFLPSFTRTLTPLFGAPRRTTATERAVRFVSSFASTAGEEFLVSFVRFLLVASRAAHKTSRFRACQIISEIIMRLPDDADVSNEVWDEVIDCMKERMRDKIPAVRVFAVCALSRFATGVENSDVIDLFLESLPQEPNSEVRKTIVLSMPPASATLVAIVGSTLDVSESVRKAAYNVIAIKFPLQSLSIKIRTTILQRGLADRSSSVAKECLKMLKEEWFEKSCDNDIITLLRFLDVETYESVGEAAIKALLESGMVQTQRSESIRQIISATCHTSDGQSTGDVKLIEPEGALYWRIFCKHLQLEAQANGSEAATTTGAKAAVYASQASLNNELLEDVIPVTVSDHVELVESHLAAGPNFRFVSRQLLLLGAMLDFSDSTNRKVASEFVHDLLHRPFEHETDEEGNEIVIGDGLNLGGDREWARAVSELAKKVHASVGEFEEKITLVIEELARPCRERSADFLQWMHCLAVSGLLLESIESFGHLQGKAVEPNELLHSLLLAGVSTFRDTLQAKHTHVDVQRVSIRCLCLFGLLERRPSAELVKQLRLSYIIGPSPVSIMACKALVDLSMWHGIHELDSAISLDQLNMNDEKNSFIPVDLNADEDVAVGLINLLYSGFEQSEPVQGSESDDLDTVQAIVGEGFAKILLLSNNYSNISNSLHPLILSRLIVLYFTGKNDELLRLKQCLSVFFEHYPALSGAHKRCVSRAFIPVMRFMWPGIHGNPSGSGIMISRMRRRATQAAHFMLQMMHTPLLSMDSQEDLANATMLSLDIDSANEGLAIRIAAEVVCCSSMKKTSAVKSYILALCGIAAQLNFRPTEQDAIKLMRGLLNYVIRCASVDSEAAKGLARLAASLRELDKSPDEEFSQEGAKAILGMLDLDVNLEDAALSMQLPITPATRSRKGRARKEASSDEEIPTANITSMTPATTCARSQRASKTVAMSRMSAYSKAEIPTLEAGSASDEDGPDMDSDEYAK